MANRSSTSRSARRADPPPAEADVAAIFERRLLARGVRSDEFLDWRASTELPPIPSLTLISFGRGSDASQIEPLAPLDTIEPAVEPEPETE